MEKIKLYDENNEEVEFFVDAKFSIDDTDYVALYTDEEEPEIYILKVVEDEFGNELLAGIDDYELNEAKKVYEELLDEIDG
ncbi:MULTISPECIES: DUF1292 domain-containing protein [Peptoniphilus]|uniref:DUF1292 domain-containing protein n=1 Tax=Peptoniphilus TaxID=162289 RepID=UPI0002893638|nr:MULTISPECIES: DUF1292 domain-containing protein [Peptoniphilus]MDU1043934.1 DUF1292 domain-containing protein [Peptoniphilus rhinitidis]MDU1954788.1 DUF1292 domain-containing protein [Peptoniphilus lacydonensis]MDU2110369.1 DUF1292 domain-containing protein [Peptoniphilus lacydonensis]MDU2115716.1 DUF1292 domain-containing protein [Peptoniphilus lacydonensis]MDU3750930.1 DUF1292 domain-containing protein [Peptoniphilus rhinitidis]